MLIIGINGVWCNQNPIWNTLRPAFLKQLPDSAFVVEEEKDCWPYEIGRLQQFGRDIVERHDTGEDMLLVGHSMGGVTACAIADQFQRSRIRGIVTIYSPHGAYLGIFSLLLQATQILRVPIVTFGAWKDELLWLGLGTSHPQSKGHTVLKSNHYLDLVQNPAIAETIARESTRLLFSSA